MIKIFTHIDAQSFKRLDITDKKIDVDCKKKRDFLNTH